jgi:hypothetical protein
MKIRLLSVCVLSFARCLLAQEAGQRPIDKESPARFIETIGRITENAGDADYVMVTHDIAHKRIRILSIASSSKTRDADLDGYRLEIIYNSVIAESKLTVVSYRFQHNMHVLTYAAAQYAAGKKDFAVRLVRILAEADPTLWWSSPTHPQIAIQEILRGLEKGDSSIGEFVQDLRDEWARGVAIYGPQSHVSDRRDGASSERPK